MKKILILILTLGFFSGFIGVKPVYGATLNELNQQKKDLQNSISANKQEIKSIQDMIGSLDSQTVATQKEINITNQIIDLTSQQISETQTQIDQKQKELDSKKADLNETIRNYYETGTPSTVEIIASANSLSDVINKSQYTEALSGQMNNQANQIVQAKTDMQNKKDELQKKETDLETQKSSLVDQQRNIKIQADEKNRLLSQANNKQSELQGNFDNISAEIYAQRRAQGGYTTGGTGGYPWANDSNYCDSDSHCPSDKWGFGIRQCTSYVAWYFNEVEGKRWYNTRPGSGDAANWPALAADQGYSVSSTPQKGAIVSWDFGRYGHVAIVESVNSNGTFNLSEYNWVPYSYSQRNNVSPAGARFIY